MKKFVTTILATSAAAVGLFFAGATSANASTTYTVKSGDSVWNISQTFNTTVNAIEKANHLSNSNMIYVGDKLIIPDGSTTTSQSATTTTTPATTSQATTGYKQSATNYNNQSSTASTNQSTGTTATTSNSGASSYNGGSTKSYVLSQMASRTGVSALTWNAIITRESGWNSSIRNSSSGAYGLFQNMHISSGDVTSQVNAAVSLYKSQGMSAWGY
ncbi:LysM peptidoglycan-binding domain-containing protein [Secundilactobacillus folii]|uniref:LysM peptidoglycan-binding domain-containing protein n=1 Tax=Secundilactobacillus folii TaxID=2678357 RepID=UPI0012D3B0E6|nr:LysM peptidoglycan-binding domain-containing protein [Secundilactobacillus folii]